MGCGASKAQAAQALIDDPPQQPPPGTPSDSNQETQPTLIPSPPSASSPDHHQQHQPSPPALPSIAAAPADGRPVYGHLPPPTEAMPANSSVEPAHPVVTPDGPLVLVLGPPGSGKDAVCERLAARFGCVHLSAVELMRTAISSSSQQGTMISNMIRAGQIVPAQVTLDLIKASIAESQGSGGPYVVQGFPKTLDSLEAMDAQLRRAGSGGGGSTAAAGSGGGSTAATGSEAASSAAREGEGAACVAALHLDLNEEQLTARLLERGRTSNRADDTADAIARRLKTYRQQEQPVVDALRARGLVTTLDASLPIEAVFEAACAVYQRVGQAPT